MCGFLPLTINNEVIRPSVTFHLTFTFLADNAIRDAPIEGLG